MPISPLIQSNLIKSTKIRFTPWKPADFGLGPFGRLLILGESHYGFQKDDYPHVTCDVVQDYIDGSNYRFFSTLSMALTGKPSWSVDRAALWNGLAFYNYVQHIVSERARVPPAEGMFTSSEAAFFEVLDDIRPTHLLACGMRLWRQMPDYSSPGSTIALDGKSYDYGPYTRAWGTVHALGIFHPSAAFEQNRWRPVIKDFLALPTNS